MLALTASLALLLAALTCLFGLRGLARLKDLHLRGGWLALGACAAQLAGALLDQRLAFLALSALLLAAFCALNWRQAGLPLAAAGLALNMLVMGANGGAMPLDPQAWSAMGRADLAPGEYLAGNKSRLLPDEEAALPWLGDRLLLPGPLRGVAAWSLGDALLLAGVGWMLWATMKGTHDAHALTLKRG
jgi:hypothetical protein